MVSQRHDILGAERIRALHVVSVCPETLGAERIRALHTVSEFAETEDPSTDPRPRPEQFSK